MTAQFFGRNELEALLGELGGDLAAKGIRGEVFIVGGAAMALAYSTGARRSTSTRSSNPRPRFMLRLAGWPHGTAFPILGSTTRSRACSPGRTPTFVR